MKKVIAASALATAGVLSAQALADKGKTGFYVTDKAGVSVVIQTDQRFRRDSRDDVYKYKGGDKNDIVFGAGLAAGYDFYQHYDVPVRTEVESYGHGAADSYYTLNIWHFPMGDGGRGDTQNRLSVNTLMVNAYYDFRNSSVFIPWVSVGLSYARIHHKATYTDTSWNRSGEVGDIFTLHYSGYDNNFAWSIGAGVRYDITSDIALDFGYRHLDVDKSSLFYKDAEGDKYKSEADVENHDIMFGATYNFWRHCP